VKRWVLIGVVGAGVVAASAVGGWLLYQRHVADRDKTACFHGTDADACYRQAVVEFKAGRISEEDRLIRQHCYHRFGIETSNSPDVAGAAMCVVRVRKLVEAVGVRE
jgi:hypothetical protein